MVNYMNFSVYREVMNEVMNHPEKPISHDKIIAIGRNALKGDITLFAKIKTIVAKANNDIAKIELKILVPRL